MWDSLLVAYLAPSWAIPKVAKMVELTVAVMAIRLVALRVDWMDALLVVPMVALWDV
jgi:hypothetical protein